MIKAVRKRQYPIIGDGAGVMPFIHLHDAAAATVLALDHDGPAIYNITDDEPAPVRDWLPVLADAVGAKPPRRVPLWLARLVAGAGVVIMTASRGASNAKAKKELGWTLRYPTWRQGFPAAYGTSPSTAPARRPGGDRIAEQPEPGHGWLTTAPGRVAFQPREENSSRMRRGDEVGGGGCRAGI